MTHNLSQPSAITENTTTTCILPSIPPCSNLANITNNDLSHVNFENEEVRKRVTTGFPGEANTQHTSELGINNSQTMPIMIEHEISNSDKRKND